MRIFTIESGRVSDGAEVTSLTLKGAGVTIPVIVVGEEGRGRERGVLPVALTTAQQAEWQAEGRTRVMFAEVGQTKAGKPKLLSRDNPGNDDRCVAVLRTHIGYRGGSAHTGDRAGWKCGSYGCDATGTEAEAPETCPKCGASGYSGAPKRQFAAWPGENLVKGAIAQGDAGRMGGGEQLVSLIPAGTVFRTAYSGRLYGGPSAHYYVFTGDRVVGGLTWEERAASDVF